MEKSAVRRIGVFTSGGDAPGMNAAVRAVVRTCMHSGIECVGIRRGYHGLIHGDVIPLNFDSVNGLLRRGGTMLYSARSEEFMEPKGQEKARDVCKMLGIDALIGIGGDGTFRGLQAMAKQGIPVIGIPGTIDNDIACTTYTIGFDTACATAVDLIDKLSDTMQSHERCSVVEVMGRHAGHLALSVGVACGAVSILIPEHQIDFEEDVIEPIRRARLNGRTHFMVIVAEGAGSAMDVAAKITEATTLETRVSVLGHIQRGGIPSIRDRITATNMGYEAVHLLVNGESNRIIALQGEDYVNYDIEEALSMEKGLNEQTYEVMRELTGVE